MTAAELTAAADRLDALADAATPGPWRVGSHYDIHLYADDAPLGTLLGTPNAAYIAAMSPPVAKALAAWLRDVAAFVSRFDPEAEDPGALALARQILGAPPP